MAVIKTNRKLLFMSTLLVSLLVFSGFFLYLGLFPNLKYAITTSKIKKDTKETPLKVFIDKETNEIRFSINFIGRVGEIERARLLKNLAFTTGWPFLVFSNELTVQLYTPKDASRKSQVMYEINGSITNLQSEQYKLRVVDQYSNLIDEKVIELEEEVLDASKSCDMNSDCIPVSCTCDCSGCGGFPYEDVVNKDYVDKWYQKEHCTKPKVCLMVCCAPRKAVCENSACVVIELGEVSGVKGVGDGGLKVDLSEDLPKATE